MRLTTIRHEELDVPDTALSGSCVSLDTFEHLNQLGEGTYGVVYRARDKRNGAIVALKTVRIFESDKGEGIPITALREISILRSLRHQNVISVLEVAVGDELDEIFMVEEYAEQDMANILDTVRVKFTPSEVKCLMKQLFNGLQYIVVLPLTIAVHKQKIIHRDLKMSNLLLTRHGILKIADFGMAREKAGWMTPQPVTIWYRAPELLFGWQAYSYPVDLWSAGCVMAELITSQPLIPGANEKEEMDLIVSLLGHPSETTWPGFKRLPWATKYAPSNPVKRKESLRVMFQTEKMGLVDLLSALLVYNPDSRLSAKECLAHKYFRETPAAQDPALLPTFPEVRNETDLRTSADKREGLLFDEGEMRARLSATDSAKRRKLDN